MNIYVLTKKGVFLHYQSVAKPSGDSLTITDKNGKIMAFYREYIAVYYGDRPILVD